MSAIHGERLIFSQSRGPDVELVVFGDEFYARYETIDGYTVVYDAEQGCYCYARLMAGHLMSSGQPLHKPPPAGIRRHLREAPAVRNAKFARRYAQLRPPEPGPLFAERTLGRDGGLLPGRRVNTGNVRGLTILVQFQDVKSTVTREHVNALLNGEDYKQNGNFCSVREYFRLVSDGNLDYRNTVVGPIELGHRRSYYINTLLVREALDRAVSEFGVDLSDFDSRGEGVIDALSIMYAGQTQYNGELWPHSNALTLRYGNMRTHFYMLTSLGRNPADLSIGTFCHESGHLLCRFPDLYDYGERDGDAEASAGMGRYCLMSSGNHLDRGRTPAPVCAYLRELASWTSNEVWLDGSGTHSAAHGDYGTVMKFQTHADNEYFVIENRSRMGLDAYLPSSGLAVYHCDILGSNEWQDGTRLAHYQCALVQSDGSLDLEHNRNAGDEGDLYKRVDGVALSHATVPSSCAWDGTDSGLTVCNISEPGETISFTLGELDRRVVSGARHANLPIPDADQAGIESAIALDARGTVASVKVSVDITHTYIGDLAVALMSPAGTRVVLHDHTGKGQDNLRETYWSSSLKALEALAGEPVSGEWRLHVSDTVNRDIGMLHEWSIEVAFAEEQYRHFSATFQGAQTIPDNDPSGIQSVLTISDSAQAQSIAVSVDIKHSYRGDLEVELVSPAGRAVTLHDRAGGNRNDIVQSYDTSTTPALGTLLGMDIMGAWTLHVVDHAPADEGRLESWSLEFMG